MNFNSNKACDCCVNAKDTQNSWQEIQVLLFGTTLELLQENIREESEQPSVLHFFEMAGGSEVGVRYNNINLIKSARLKFDDLVYAFKHPIYHKVEYRDLKNRVS